VRGSRRNTGLFQERQVWKEKTSDAYIVIGHPNGNEIPCFLAKVHQDHTETSYEKGDFWCNANAHALFEHFIKII
jgi:hypothetical protein